MTTRLALGVLWLCVALSWGATAAKSQELVTDLTDHVVRITTAFRGTSVVLFGAAPEGGDVVVTVSGPPRDMVVRRKRQVAGIWFNGSSVTFSGVPGFYAMFSSRPLDQLLSPAAQAFEGVGAAALALSPREAVSVEERAAYRQALIDNLQKQGLYAGKIGEVQFLGGKLFRTSITFPSDTPVGTYTVETMLIENDQAVAWDRTPFAVEKAGLPAEINNFAQDHGLIYGLLAVCAAALTGWLSAQMFRKG